VTSSRIAEPGALQIGATRLDFATLAPTTHRDLGWRQAFNPGADLLLYGCDLAAPTTGARWYDALSRLIRSRVAASTDVTAAPTPAATGRSSTAPVRSSRTRSRARRNLAAWDATLGLTPTGSDILVNSTITSGTQTTNSGGSIVHPVRALPSTAAGNSVVVLERSCDNGGRVRPRFDAAGARSVHSPCNTTTSNTQDEVTVA